MFRYLIHLVFITIGTFEAQVSSATNLSREKAVIEIGMISTSLEPIASVQRNTGSIGLDLSAGARVWIAIDDVSPSRSRIPDKLPLDNTLERVIWYGIVTLLVLLIVVLIVIAYRELRRYRSMKARKQMMAYLIRIDDPSRRHLVFRSPWTIGRDRENDLTIDDHSVSRHHAEIQYSSDVVFTIIDLGSRNGVYVNQSKVITCVMKDGDQVEIGDVRFRFAIEQSTHKSVKDLFRSSGPDQQ